jgi:hypothetical protein
VGGATRLSIPAVLDFKIAVLPLSICGELCDRRGTQAVVPRGCAGQVLIHAARVNARCRYTATKSMAALTSSIIDVRDSTASLSQLNDSCEQPGASRAWPWVTSTLLVSICFVCSLAWKQHVCLVARGLG